MLFWRVMAGEGSSIDDTFIDKRQAQLDAEEAARQEAIHLELKAQADSAGRMVAIQALRYMEEGKGFKLILEPAEEGVQEIQVRALPIADKHNEGESGVGG
jgi:hypothetical protein